MTIPFSIPTEPRFSVAIRNGVATRAKALPVVAKVAYAKALPKVKEFAHFTLSVVGYTVLFTFAYLIAYAVAYTLILGLLLIIL